jgi:hypothetical protein
MPTRTPIDTLEAYLARWTAAHLACGPADRRTAEEGVRLAYAAVGLAPPRHIIWCGGPLEIARRLANASAADAFGVNVKAKVFDDVRDRVGTFAEIFWKEVVTAAAELSGRRSVGVALDRLSRSKQASAAINGTAIKAADGLLGRLRTRARHAALRWSGQPRLLPRSGFHEIAVGPHDLASLGVYEYLHDVLAWQEPTQTMRGLWRIARSASWIVPHERVCWVCERPDILRTDALGRLHCQDGPALRYPDGWSVYAWKGVEVPAWMIEHPERITIATIADTLDPVLRNCMIEIVTPQRLSPAVAPAGSPRTRQASCGASSGAIAA